MATAGSGLSEVDYLRQNQQLLGRLCGEFEEAAQQLDSTRNTIRRARYAGVGVGVLGILSAPVTGGASAALSVGATLLILYALSRVVEKILKSWQLKEVENNWSHMKDRYTTDLNIPRKNKEAITDWARQTLPPDQATIVIKAIEKCTSNKRSSERLKQLDSTDKRALLDSLLLLVAADFSVFEILLGTVAEKDDPGGAVRHVLHQMREYRHELNDRIKKKEQEEEREEEEKRRRDEEENRRREEKEKRRREEEEKRRREEEEKRRQEEEKKQYEEEEKLRQEPESVHSVKLKFDILPSSMHNTEDPSNSKPATPSDDSLERLPSPEQDLPVRASLEPPVSDSSQGTQPPSFCDRWEIINRFDSSGGTMQKERSQVVLQIPPRAIKPTLFADVCLAVCTDVEKIHHLLSLGDCDFIASPMVELSAGADFLFERTVKIFLPHCLPRRVSPEQLIIYRAAVNSNGDRVLRKVPARQDQAGDRPSTHADVLWDDDATYRVTDDRKIVISTHRFSSYVCIQCGREILGSPILLFIGSGINKVMPDKTQEATVDVHIWDERLNIPDFAEQIQNRVTDAEQLTVDLAGVDKKNQTVKLNLDVTRNFLSLWRHCSLPSLPQKRNIPLEQVLGCNTRMCTRNRKMKPFVVHWRLETSELTTNALMLKCVLDITCVQETCNAQLPIELKEPLNRQQLRELNLQQLKDNLFDQELLFSADIDEICPTGGNGDENDLKRRLIERAEVNRRRPPPLTHLGDRIQNPRRAPSPAYLEDRIHNIHIENPSDTASSRSSDD